MDDSLSSLESRLMAVLNGKCVPFVSNDIIRLDARLLSRIE